MQQLFHKQKTISGVRKLKKISMSTVLVLAEAEKQGVSWKKIRYTDLFKLKYQGQTKYFHGQVPSETTEFAHYCCKHKHLSKSILASAGLAVSKGFMMKRSDDPKYKEQLFAHLEKPLVVKPADAQSGDNVFINITTLDEYRAALEAICLDNGNRKVSILVEQMFFGDEFRILATQKKILSIIKRVRANVVGDGESTISELIAQKNADPVRQKMQTYHEILIDETVVAYLANQELTLASIIPTGQQVFLRPAGPLDISWGGDTVDVTDKVHESVRENVTTIMESIPGLSLAGIDYMTTDITANQTKDNYRIIEVNASPSLDWNQYPLAGPKRDIAFEFLRIMFPNLTQNN